MSKEQSHRWRLSIGTQCYCVNQESIVKLLVCCDISQFTTTAHSISFQLCYTIQIIVPTTMIFRRLVTTTTIMFAFHPSRILFNERENKTLNYKMKNKATQSLNTIILSCSHPRAFHSTTPLHYYFQRSILHPELQQSIHTPIDTHES
mmetsp:Transcript_1504/g.3222  ORF Transcript_1504/g.3222 Transcript_1504/m.3222 type:complete len:148 (+) Transcript_1504:739-1182(+)